MTIDTAMLRVGQGWISFLSRFEAKSGLHWGGGGGGGGGRKGGACARLWGNSGLFWANYWVILSYFGLCLRLE